MLMLIGIFMLTTSCVEIDGRLQVHEAFTVKKKSGFLNRKTKEVRVDPRAYTASIKFVSDKKYNLQLDGGSLDNISVPLKAERDLKIPSNGRFYISHETIDQPFDVGGVIDTQRESSGYNTEMVSCSWNTTERKCEKVCSKETNRCEVQCRDVTTTFYGRKRVEYHYSIVRRHLELEIMRANSTGVVATFVGSDTETNKVIDRESSCW
jgi:hypothetical protein